MQVLVIPENFADLYELPEAVLNAIRATVTSHLPVKLEAPGKVSLFVYDNGTFVTHSFSDEPVKVTAVLDAKTARVEDAVTKEKLSVAERRGSSGKNQSAVVAKTVSFTLPPHSFRALRSGS